VASAKQYKDRFKLWGWQKNLPAETAQFMIAKANERKRRNKDTVFKFGGMTWTPERAQTTVKRAKKVLSGSIRKFALYADILLLLNVVDDMATPDGVIYQTPASHDPTSPSATPSETANYEPLADSMEVDVISSSSVEDEWESDSQVDPEPLPLLW